MYIMIYDMTTNYNESGVLSGSAAMALIESARSDHAMFTAMLECDARELGMRNDGSFNESSIVAFNEAVQGGIFKKIASAFKWLANKIMEIVGKFNQWLLKNIASDKTLVKRLRAAIQSNPRVDVNTIQVKWRHNRLGDVDKITDQVNFDWRKYDVAAFLKLNPRCDLADCLAQFAGGEGEYDTIEQAVSDIKASIWKDKEPVTTTVGEIGGVKHIVDVFSNYSKQSKALDANAKDANKYFKSAANSFEKAANKGMDDKDAKEAIEATAATTCMSVYKAVTIAKFDAVKDALTVEYKQCKAALLKCIAACRGRDFEECAAIYAEADCQEEVDGVISCAINSNVTSEIEDLSMAGSQVKDSGVSDDPYKLTYQPDCYTNDYLGDDDVDGYVDTNIQGTTEESAIFSAMLY